MTAWPFKFSSKLWPQDVLTDCSFPITWRIQSATQRALGYVYTRFWDNITSLIKIFNVCNPDSQINFLCLLHTVKVQFLFALAHQKYTPSPRASSFSVHLNLSFLRTLIKRVAKGKFSILKIKTICFHSWYKFFFFFLSKENQSFKIYIRRTFV